MLALRAVDPRVPVHTHVSGARSRAEFDNPRHRYFRKMSPPRCGSMELCMVVHPVFDIFLLEPQVSKSCASVVQAIKCATRSCAGNGDPSHFIESSKMATLTPGRPPSASHVFPAKFVFYGASVASNSSPCLWKTRTWYKKKYIARGTPVRTRLVAARS